MARLGVIIDSIVFYFLSIALALLVVICFAQVVARYIFNASFSWAEEVSICLMLWATWGGACYAFKQRSHLRIPFVTEKMVLKTRLICQLALNGLVIIFLATVAFTSRIVIDGMENSTFFSLPEVPLNTMYTSVPVGCALMIYYILRVVVTDWKTLCDQAQKDG